MIGILTVWPEIVWKSSSLVLASKKAWAQSPLKYRALISSMRIRGSNSSNILGIRPEVFLLHQLFT